MHEEDYTLERSDRRTSENCPLEGRISAGLKITGIVGSRLTVITREIGMNGENSSLTLSAVRGGETCPDSRITTPLGAYTTHCGVGCSPAPRYTLDRKL